MQYPNRSRSPIRDILALTLIALCALIVVAALLSPDAGFAPLLPLLVGAVVLVARYYFEKRA